MKAILVCLLWIALLCGALFASWAVWFKPKAVQTTIAETAKKATEAIAEMKAKANSDEKLYELVCDRIREKLKAPRTAIFAELGKDQAARVVRHGRGVVEVTGFVDSQNSFSALIRAQWRLAGIEKSGDLDVFYVKFGDDEMGDEEDIGRRSKGLPTLAEVRIAEKAKADEEEKQKAMQRTFEVAAATKAKEEAENVSWRPVIFTDAQQAVRARMQFPNLLKFSELQTQDDQFSVSRRFAPRLWESRGIVDYVQPNTGKRMRAPWRVLTLVHERGYSRVLHVEAPGVLLGTEADAVRIAREER